MDHLPIDTNNIKVSLTHIVKHIKNKQVNCKNINNIKNLNGIGKAVWLLISSIYKSK